MLSAFISPCRSAVSINCVWHCSITVLHGTPCTVQTPHGFCSCLQSLTCGDHAWTLMGIEEVPKQKIL
ncbi:hypothetical protein DAI22_02g343100 [Oryza sativa Japonica Group]|nr:hypothetical protein DAI22_02g343100 [Oryza sativa Japonica Group]